MAIMVSCLWPKRRCRPSTSDIGSFAPARVASLVMGVWFLATSVGDLIAGMVSGLYETLSGTTIFGVVALVTLGFAVLLAFLVRPIRQMLERA